jgi:threonine dehydratase
MRNLDQPTLDKGVTAVSAGNHAIAVAFAAQLLGTTAKVVMPKTANPARVATCRSYGATVELVDNVAVAFERVQQIQAEEGRYFVHPFEGQNTILGAATVGLEFATQVADLDAVIIPIGGGGLCAGMATAIKQLQPNCQIFGVEPVGADTMHRSFAAGSPQSIASVQTIAVEPAGATATAALWGPLQDRLRGRRVGVIVCGANIDIDTFAKHVKQAETVA